MAEVLSQDEINRFLNAINSQSGDDAASDIVTERRPDKFSKEQIQAFSYIHETFAHVTTYSLSAYLRSRCGVRVASVDQLIYEEFIRSVPTPTNLATFTMEPLNGDAVMEIDIPTIFPIVDRICGGKGDGKKYHDELTDIESYIKDKIIVHILGNLSEAWKKIIDIQPQVKAFDFDPQSVRIVSPNEQVVLVTLDVKIEKTKGMINICIPCAVIEPIMEKLTNWYYGENPDNAPLASAVEPAEGKVENTPNGNEEKNFRSFDYLNRVDPNDLLNFIQLEHPQIIALILARMEEDKASVVLQNLNHEIQSNVLLRIVTMDEVRPEITSEIVRILEDKLVAWSSAVRNSIGGIESAVKIFNLCDQYAKKQIIDSLEKDDPVLAEEIRKRAGMK